MLWLTSKFLVLVLVARDDLQVIARVAQLLRGHVQVAIAGIALEHELPLATKAPRWPGLDVQKIHLIFLDKQKSIFSLLFLFL
jgi:hypothetical protein